METNDQAVAKSVADTLNDGTGPESVACDSAETLYGLVLEAPEPMKISKGESAGQGMSWVLGGMLLLFVVIAFRYRSNIKYVQGLIRDLYEVRERSNVFDDTVRETSFMLLLDMLWCVSAGVLLAAGIREFTAEGIGICTLVGLGYQLFMCGAYWGVGSVFSDGRHASMWLRGHMAGTGLTSIALFPLALLQICYPADSDIWVWIGVGVYCLVKLVFLAKGFRIFFTQAASWVLFLCYLCSLEIVPLILAYLSAFQLCFRLL